MVKFKFKINDTPLTRKIIFLFYMYVLCICTMYVHMYVRKSKRSRRANYVIEHEHMP